MALQSLNEQGGEEYVRFHHLAMVGVLVVGFCKVAVRPHITEVYSSKVKTGMGGSTGNKGATVMRFKLDDTTVAVANGHLESGQGKVEARIAQMKEVILTAFRTRDERQMYDFHKHKIKFFFGDLNFRVNMEYCDVVEACTSEWSKRSLQTLM